MGKSLFAHPAAQEVLAQARGVGWGNKVEELGEAELADTAVAQPAIFLVEWAGWAILQTLGREEEAVAGHSLGEFAALAAAGAIPWLEAFRLVVLRGKLMAEAAQERPGGMVAILGLAPEEVEALAERCGCFVANLNAPGQVVVAGNPASLKEIGATALTSGGKAVPLAVAGAFHSPFMRRAADRFAQALEDLELLPPQTPFVSSVSGELEKDPQRIRGLLAHQMAAPVRWIQAVETLASLGVEEAWEVGPGEVLSRLGRRITSRIRFRALAEVLPDG